MNSKFRTGSNQYRLKNKHFLGVTPEAWASIWFVTTVSAVLIPLVRPAITSPCPDNGCGVSKVEAAGVEAKIELKQLKEELNKPTKTNIIAFIAKTFEKEGTHVQVKAISCFYSESGLRTDAYNWNPGSNSEDIGVAQVNLKYHPDVKKKDMYDWKKNITKAYQIYKSRGNFSAWYGKGC